LNVTDKVADEGYSQVAYEKGANLLLHIERLVGGLDVFVPYMQDYDRTFTGTSITTDQWRNHMFHYFGSLPNSKELVKKLGQLDWDEVSHLPCLKIPADTRSGFTAVA
jgi:leukotriene-A4 hydrolase